MKLIKYIFQYTMNRMGDYKHLISAILVFTVYMSLMHACV